MAVAFDAVGPAGGGGATIATSGGTFTHVNSAAGNAIFAGMTCFSGTTNNVTAITYGGAAMPQLGAFVPANNVGTGGNAIYGKVAGLATGTNNVAVTFTISEDHNGGSVSFTGAGSFGTPATAFASGASVTVSVPGTTAGNMIAAAASFGSNGGTWGVSSGGTLRWKRDVSAGSGSDNTVGGTWAAAGGTQSVGFTNSLSDYWALNAVEVKVPVAGTTVTAGLATAAGAAGAPAILKGAVAGLAAAAGTAPAATAKVPVVMLPGVAAATAAAPPAGTGKKYLAGLAGTGINAYFTDQGGAPVLPLIEQAWALPFNAGRWNGGNWQSDIDAYMSTRASQGYTVWAGVAWGNDHVDSTVLSGGRTWDGIYPIVVNGTPGKITTGSETITLNDPFWQRIDYLFTSALKNGISCYLNLGMQYDFTGSPNIWFNLSTAQAYTFGALIVARYPRASYPNVFFFFGDDGSGGQDTFFTQMLSGITDAGDTRHVSVEQLPETNSHIEFDTTAVYLPGGFGEASANYNWVYTYDPSYNGVEKSYTELPVPGRQPVVWGDGVWYGDNSSTQNIADYTIRRFTWWALASGARGFNDTSGSTNNGLVWQWQNGALAAVTTDPNGTFVTSTCGVITTYFTSLAGWHTLIPDTGNVFITSGRGTKTTNDAPGFNPAKYGDSDNYVAGSITPDGSLAVIYCGQFFTITINQALLAPGYTATWVDPVTAATTATATGGTYNSTPLGNNSAGNADWVLVLQGPPAPPAPFTAQPALPGKTWRRYFQHPQQPVPPAPVVTGISVSAGLATATGTALGQDTGADIAMVSPNAGLPAATGTALGQDTGADIASVAPGAGLPAATGTALGQDTGADIAMVSPNAGLPAATGAALGASAQVVLPQNAAYPGAVWRKYFQHPQQPAAFTAPAPATNVSGGLAQATGTALGQDTGADIASVAPNAGLPAATAAALGATSSLATNGGTAAATGTGQNPAPSIAIGAAPAAGTGTALDASVVTTGAPPLMQVLPGRTWLRQFRHLQQPLPPPPFTAPPFQVARSTPSAAAPDTSAAGVSDPRDGTTSVAALATSSPGVT